MKKYTIAFAAIILAVGAFVLFGPAAVSADCGNPTTISALDSVDNGSDIILVSDSGTKDEDESDTEDEGELEEPPPDEDQPEEEPSDEENPDQEKKDE